MKLCLITVLISIVVKSFVCNPEDTSEDKSDITFQAVLDPITRKIRVEKQQVLEKSAEEKELDAENSLIPNVQLNDKGEPEYIEADATKFDIKDVDKLDDNVMAYIKAIRYNVLLNLKTSISQSQIDHSYLIYKNLAQINDRYFMTKPALRAKATRLRDVTSFALNYARDATKEQMKHLITAADVELDEYNKKILIALLERLDQQAQKIWEGTYITLENYMKDIADTRTNPQISPANKLSKLIESSLQLAIFQKEVVDDGTYQMKGLISLVIDNPKYHHLTQGFSAVLNIKASAPIVKAVTFVLLLILIKIR